MKSDSTASILLQPSDPMVGVVLSKPKRATTSALSLLPLELQRRIASYLLPEDAMNLTESGVAADRLIVRALHPDRSPGKHIPPLAGSYRTGDRPRPTGLRLRLVTDVSKEIVHSMTLHAQWKDQGWGNQKGGLFIVAKPRITSEGLAQDAIPCFSIDVDVDDDRVCFDGGRVVAMTTEVAPHEWGHVQLSFIPLEGETYYLWYRVGGGGGHELHLKDCFLQTFVYDDLDSSFSNTYQVLYNLGVISCSNLRNVLPPIFPVVNTNADPDLSLTLDIKSKYFQAERSGNDTFYPNLLLRVAQSGQHQLASENEGVGPKPDPALDFLIENGLQFNEATLHAIEAIVQSYIDELNYDWLVYSAQRQKFRSMHSESSSTNRSYRRGVPRELLQFLAGNGNRHLPAGGPIAINGFRIVVQQPDGPPAPVNGGPGIHVERIPPPQGIAEGNAMPPQVVNNPDGIVSILLGSMVDNTVAVPRQEMEVDNAPPQVPPAVGMFGIARAAMAAAFGFDTNIENNGPPAPNNNGQFVMQEVTIGGDADDFGAATAFFAAMAEEMQADLARENDDMDEDAEEVFAQ